MSYKNTGVLSFLLKEKGETVMLFKNRIWQVFEVGSSEELANKLVNYTWTLCAGFKLGDYYFLNDSTSENGAQEYAVLQSSGRQIESITFGWCSYQEALRYIQKILDGEYDDESWESGIDIHRQLQTPEEHGRCAFCV
jgi:hypothetical protein